MRSHDIILTVTQRTENNGPILLRLLQSERLTQEVMNIASDRVPRLFCGIPLASLLVFLFGATVSLRNRKFIQKFRNYKSVRMFRESGITPPTIVASVKHMIGGKEEKGKGRPSAL